MDQFEDVLSIKRSMDELVAIEEDQAESLSSIACSMAEIVEQMFIMNSNQNIAHDELNNALYVILHMSRETLLTLQENREQEVIRKLIKEEKDT